MYRGLGAFSKMSVLQLYQYETSKFNSGNAWTANVMHGTLVVHFQDILVDDEIWEQGVLESVDIDGTTSLSPTSNFRAWTALTEADFSRNDLPYIDESVVNTINYM